MAEALLNRVLNDEAAFDAFLEWLTKLKYQDPKFACLSAEYKCSRADFVTFFLNYVHEELGSALTTDKKSDVDGSKSSSEINRSHSFPLDLSSELDDSIKSSTPKMTKVSSDTSVQSYMSPVSPIYKTHASFTTPKCHKSLCLGDFIVTRRASSKKKSQNSETKRRIKPTNLTQKVNGFHKSENSFNFNRSEPDELPNERHGLAEERLKILSRSSIPSGGSPKKISRGFPEEVSPDRGAVNHPERIDKLVRVYVHLLDNHFVSNLTSEVYFLITLLLRKQFYSIDWGIGVLNDKWTSILFNSIHNVVYFAAKSLESQIRILRNYDNSTVRLLVENRRLAQFSPVLVENLQNISKPDRIIEVDTFRDNICFNSDTDNRQNFPNDPSFHAFRKQRDLFYEILRLWERHHMSPGFSYSISLSGKIKTLLSLSTEPTNFIHFARLFKAQLLSTCQNGGCDDFVTSLDVDAQKLSKLKSRCVTKANCQGLNSLPKFTENEEFYRDFILVGANHGFNRHLADALIDEIVELNETSFSNELDTRENDVDLPTKKSYYLCIKSSRILAKFLGFIESIPYKTECNNYSEHLLARHLRIRQQVRPNFDVKSLLENSIRRKSVILCVPWLIKYLSMLDYVTLKLPYYTSVHTNLFWIYRNFDWGPDCNIYLVKFCLGWLFELPHLPDHSHLHYTEIRLDFEYEVAKTGLDQLTIVDQNILYYCCPYLDEIKKLLTATSTSHSITIKHITPVTALQSPDEVARKKLEQQLEEAFFNGQPISLRKTVEFVSERVASTCVKYVCGTLVPSHKKNALERLKSTIVFDPQDDVEAQKVALHAKANELAAACLQALQESCDREIESISSPKIRGAVDALASLDILPQTKEVCIGIAKKTCLERVKQWVNSHVTLGIFSKDFHDEVQRLAHSEGRKYKKPLFMLPPDGTNPNHNDSVTSAAHLIDKFTALTIHVIENKRIEDGALVALLDETTKSINERGDFNQCILATICTQLLDLFLLLLAHEPSVVRREEALSKCCDIWRLYYNGCDELFKSLLCPRNVRMFAGGEDKKATWDAFAEFCARLMERDMLSHDNFESQCTGIFRRDWDKDTLKVITEFLRTFVKVYSDRGGSASDFTFILEFLSDYCEDLF